MQQCTRLAGVICVVAIAFIVWTALRPDSSWAQRREPGQMLERSGDERDPRSGKLRPWDSMLEESRETGRRRQDSILRGQHRLPPRLRHLEGLLDGREPARGNRPAVPASRDAHHEPATGSPDQARSVSSPDDGVVEQWVARYASGLVPASDVASALVIDTSTGNVFVTGTSNGDYLTIKYDSTGVEQWVARYNGPGNSDDLATALAVDASGNVYVTGESRGSGTSYDYATVKYNASGAQEWVARYNGPGNYYDYATALAVDGSGNVYVTGWSYGSGWTFPIFLDMELSQYRLV